jgi:O-methyltransferase involved in polyketide biosynthesis
MVVNLAAGLDARPYRMSLPPALRWVEVDLPDLLAYKEEVLAGEKPVCALERTPLDLADAAARRELFQRLGREAKRALVISEGLIIYFTAEEVAALARDLATPASFRYWILDMTSPALLKMLQKSIGGQLDQASAPLKFAPREGPEFFRRHGWTPREVHSLLHTAAKLKRLSFFMRLLSLLPDPAGRQPDKPWGGLCLLENNRNE